MLQKVVETLKEDCNGMLKKVWSFEDASIALKELGDSSQVM